MREMFIFGVFPDRGAQKGNEKFWVGSAALGDDWWEAGYREEVLSLFWTGCGLRGD